MHIIKYKKSLLITIAIFLNLAMITIVHAEKTNTQSMKVQPKSTVDCRQYAEGEPRSSCLQKLAIETNDVALCLTIPKESFLFASRCDCLTGVAKKTGEIKTCDRSNDPECRDFCRLEFNGKGWEFRQMEVTRANELDKQAIKRRDVRICNKQKNCVERSECILQVALDQRNPKLCTLVRSCPNPLTDANTEEQHCRSAIVEKNINDVVVEGNIPRCDRLKGTFGSKGEFLAGVFLQAPIQARDFCRIKMASNYARADVCEVIRDRRSKDHCFMLAAVTPVRAKPKIELCKIIKDKEIQKECISRARLLQ